jgi:hypothetical protein
MEKPKTGIRTLIPEKYPHSVMTALISCKRSPGKHHFLIPEKKMRALYMPWLEKQL